MVRHIHCVPFDIKTISILLDRGSIGRICVPVVRLQSLLPVKTNQLSTLFVLLFFIETRLFWDG